MFDLIEYVSNQLANTRIRLMHPREELTKKDILSECELIEHYEALLRQSLDNIRDLLKKLEGDDE